jgi:CRISPR/Cas system-associated exonuclease Cas4 (RecB family)
LFVDPVAKSTSATSNAFIVKSALHVIVKFPVDATPVGVTNLISWFAAVDAFKRESVAVKLVIVAAIATVGLRLATVESTSANRETPLIIFLKIVILKIYK